MLEDELDSSELGTLEYWDQRYRTEIKNFQQHGDAGEIWFGEDIVDRIIQWISETIPKEAKIIDVGCGNGHILLELFQLGYTDLLGVDYAETAINLARAVATKHNSNIKYEVCDILKGLPESYDLIHDKGTYDAISLSENSKEACKLYGVNVTNSLRVDGYFVITSCNWTTDELVAQFKELFVLHRTIPTPQFKFGGKVGSVVSICVFKK